MLLALEHHPGQCSSCPSNTFLSAIGNGNQACVQCLSNNNCTNPATSVCTSGTCNGCQTDNDCSHLLAFPSCLSGTCIRCQNNHDCADSSKPICELSTGFCHARIFVAKPDVQCVQGISSPEIFTLTVPSSFMVSPRRLLSMNVSLQYMDSTLYSYTLNSPSNTLEIVTFSVKQQIPPTNLLVTLVFQNQTQDDTFDYRFSTKVIPFNSDADKAQQTTKNVITTTLIVAASVSGTMVLAGGSPLVLWTLFNIIQAFYYLILINIDYPPNVEILLNIFKVAKLDFVPNPIDVIVPDMKEQSLPAPKKFDDNGFDALFLANSGNILLLWGLIGFLYGASLFILKYFKGIHKGFKILCRKIISWFRWSGAYQIIDANFVSLLIPAFLQVRELSFTSSLFFTSSVFGIIFSCLGGLFIIAVYIIIKKLVNDESISKYSAFVEGYRLDQNKAKLFNVAELLKKLVTAAVLVFLYEHPLILLGILLLMNILMVIITLVIRPYKKTWDCKLKIIMESLFGVLHLAILILGFEEFYSDCSKVTIVKYWMGNCCHNSPYFINKHGGNDA